MTLLVFGLNHRTAPLELREKLAMEPERLPSALESLARQVAPGVILSTCNRLEIYTLAPTNPAYSEIDEESPASPVSPEPLEALNNLQEFVADYSGLPPEALIPYSYHYQDADCVRHLFRVTSGLDSMVVGEWEILGQVRAAFSAASASGGGPGTVSGNAAGGEPGLGYVRGPLSRLFHQALRVGRRVHHGAQFGSNLGEYRRRSVSHVGVRLVHRLLGDLSQRQVLLIGAGNAGQLAGRALAAAGATNLVIANRTYHRAASLSAELSGVALPFEQLRQSLADADAVISTTASPDYLLKAGEIEEVMALRQGRPLLLIDLAVPRDIEPAAGLLPGVTLCDIDALRATSDAASVGMEPEIARAEELVAEETIAFMDWWDSLDAISAIATIREYAEKIRRAEVSKTVARLKKQEAAESDTEALAAHLDAMTSALVKKLLHHPTVYLREAKDPGRQQTVLEMFNLAGKDGPDVHR